MTPALSLQTAMRDALLADAGLMTLLGGAHVFDEVPRGEQPPHLVFAGIETRDWSVHDQKAHELFVSLEIATHERGRTQAYAICERIETLLDNAALVLNGHRLINLRAVFWTVMRMKNDKTIGATMRFRAATEPL
jgi:Protein of unknown function (DUF3168)